MEVKKMEEGIATNEFISIAWLQNLKENENKYDEFATDYKRCLPELNWRINKHTVFLIFICLIRFYILKAKYWN